MWGAGLFALGRFADSVGLTGALSAAVPQLGERAPVHDRGAVLTHALLTAAAGGEACSDIEHLRAQPELFGDVASDSTLYRTLTALGASGPAALGGAAAQVREQVWADRDRSGRLVVDIDSTLVEVHSENKAGAAPRGWLVRWWVRYCVVNDLDPTSADQQRVDEFFPWYQKRRNRSNRYPASTRQNYGVTIWDWLWWWRGKK